MSINWRCFGASHFVIQSPQDEGSHQFHTRRTLAVTEYIFLENKLEMLRCLPLITKGLTTVMHDKVLDESFSLQIVIQSPQDEGSNQFHARRTLAVTEYIFIENKLEMLRLRSA